ncbi:hypothetical protein [Corynebacterium lowii]|uniref:Matrixin n=1 Tax=Corynebacterium lowii TaxID=1544413 RepID=A0A0Q0ULQ9_9CORY|nr:hypothetical protein [Corynebacterium lowii]KQB87336.1 hypothetical protein Clow_00391 [Corynebacterium lowii]MDP9852075.1 hypothetical protein [Corynebacterium lowii]
MKYPVKHGSVTLSAILASVSMAVTVPAAQAGSDLFTHITSAQCTEAHNAIAAGEPLPDPSLFRFRDRPSSMEGDTLHVYVSDRAEALYGKEIRQATQAWTDASDGKIKFEYHDELSDGVVDIRVQDNNQGAVATAGGQGTERPYLRLRPTIGAESRVFTIAHELGHQMGLAHSCAGDIMKSGATRGPVTLLPTATDVAAVMQGNPAFE